MILLRHGQSAFNAVFSVARRDPGIPDPGLTALGRAQAERAAADLAGHGIRHLIASPYTRTLQTADALARALGVPIIVDPTVRERYAFSCDIGTPRSALAAAWPALDFTRMDEVWWPAVEEPASVVEGRAALFRAAMRAVSEWETVAVVSHWGFILSLTGKSLGNGEWMRFDPAAAPPAEIAWTD